MSPCKHQWESSYAEFLCSQSDSFCCINPAQCEVCENFCEGLPSPEMQQRFKEWDEKYTKRREDAEYYYSRSLDFSCGLARLNQLQAEGREQEVTALREELLEEYQKDGLIDLVLDDERWKSILH